MPPRPGDPPPSVRWIRGVTGWLVARPIASGAALLLGALLISLLPSVVVVDSGETGAVQRFGRLTDEGIPPGLTVRLPWGIDRVTRVRTGEVQRREVTEDIGRLIALVSGDENFLELTLVAQYTIRDPGAYLLRVDDPAALIDQAVRAALVATVAGMPVDDVLTGGKARIQHAVRRAAQATLDRCGVGVTLIGINLQAASPPPEAAQAFRDVSDARADAARAVNEAQSDGERALSLARGRARGLVEEARAGADARRRRADGAAARFAALLARQRAAPAQTSGELYLDTARRVLPRARLVLLAPGEPPRIDLNLMEPRRSALEALP